MNAVIDKWVKNLLGDKSGELFEFIVGLTIRILLTACIVLVCVQLIRILKKLIKKGLVKLKVEESVGSFIASLISIGLYVILGFMVATSFGVDAASVVAILGSAGVTLGLALQGSLSNFAGGMLLQIFRPFKVGDYIIEDNYKNQGVVKEIGLFYTKLEAAGDKIVILPNGPLANTSLTNATPSSTRLLIVKFQIAYHCDILLAKDIIRKEMMNEKHTLNDKMFEVMVNELLADGVEIEGRCYVHTQDYRYAKGAILESVKLKFDEAGIEIPFPQLTLHQDSDIKVNCDSDIEENGDSERKEEPVSDRKEN